MAFNGRYHKGYMRVLREIKRTEASGRNEAYRKSKEQDSGATLLKEIFSDPENT